MWIVLANRPSPRTRGSKSTAQDEEKKIIFASTRVRTYLSRLILALSSLSLTSAKKNRRNKYDVFHVYCKPPNNYIRRLLIASSGIFLNATEYDEREATDIRPLFRSRWRISCGVSRSSPRCAESPFPTTFSKTAEDFHPIAASRLSLRPRRRKSRDIFFWRTCTPRVLVKWR